MIDQVQHLEIENESRFHSVPPHSESHFKVTIASDTFARHKTRVQRHRLVNDVLKEELANGVHALSIHPFTMDEWVAVNGETPKSPGMSPMML